MKSRISSLVLLILLAGLQPSTASSTVAQKLAVAENGFAFKLLKQIASEQPAANIFISPYSAATVLQMVGTGAAGQTRAGMQQVLGTAGLSSETVGVANRDIAQSLNHDNTNVILTTANVIWYRAGSPVKPEFIARNHQFFGATVDAINFADPHAAGIINAWASD